MGLEPGKRLARLAILVTYRTLAIINGRFEPLDMGGVMPDAGKVDTKPDTKAMDGAMKGGGGPGPREAEPIRADITGRGEILKSSNPGLSDVADSGFSDLPETKATPSPDKK